MVCVERNFCHQEHLEKLREPPVNIEVVSEIRQKVSEGRYPIDLNAITNKLFESIKEGEG